MLYIPTFPFDEVLSSGTLACKRGRSAVSLFSQRIGIIVKGGGKKKEEEEEEKKRKKEIRSSIYMYGAHAYTASQNAKLAESTAL